MTTLLDHNGNPIDMAAVRSELAAQAAEPQTSRVANIWREFDAHPSRGLTPAKLRALLVNGERGDLSIQCDLADDMERLAPLSGVHDFPSRVKCATLAWHTLNAALDGAAKEASSE